MTVFFDILITTVFFVIIILGGIYLINLIEEK